MKLFIWEGGGVLEGYTTGMIVAIAPNYDAAIAAIEATGSAATYHHQGMKDRGEPRHFNFPPEPTEIVELGEVEVQPKAWVVYGGG